VEAEHITQEQADEYAIGALPGAAEREIGLHLVECTPCRARVQAAERVAAALSLGLGLKKPPRRLRGRVFASAGITRPSLLSRAFRYSRAVAGIAAVFVAIAAFTGMVSVRGQIRGLNNQNDRLQTQINDALSQKVEIAALTQRLTEEERTSADLRLSARADRDLLLAMMSPESEVAELYARDQASVAIGRLIWDREQKKVWLVANRLSPRPRGETYQLWINSAGRWISLGTFNSDASGFVRFDAVVAADLQSYESAVVTIERAGGAAERSGPSVFVADLSRVKR
jgi:anti-sigma-K factor RskA